MTKAISFANGLNRDWVKSASRRCSQRRKSYGSNCNGRKMKSRLFISIIRLLRYDRILRLDELYKFELTNGTARRVHLSGNDISRLLFMKANVRLRMMVNDLHRCWEQQQEDLQPRNQYNMSFLTFHVPAKVEGKPIGLG